MFSTVSDEEVKKMAKEVSWAVHRKSPGVEQADIESAILLEIVEVCADMRDPSAGRVEAILRKAATIYAAKERYRMMLETSQYIYTSKEVRALLKTYWDPMSWDVPTGRDDYLQAEVERRVAGVSLIDLQSCMDGLKVNHRRNLERKFRDNQEVDTQLVYRAVDALVRALNRNVVQKTKDHNGPGARRAMTNARAQHLTEELGGEQERDALDKVQAIYKRSPSKPAGTYFDWDKYKEGDGRD